MFLPAWGDSPPTSCSIASPVGEVRLVPDWKTFKPMPGRPQSGMVHCLLLSDKDTPPICPRTFLKTVLNSHFMSYTVLKVMVGFELEFNLFRKTSISGISSPLPSQPVDDSVYCQTSSYDGCATILETMVTRLEEIGIECIQIHAESAPGQFEISMKHAEAITAADNLIFAKEIISAVATDNGLDVSFLPKLSPSAAGNGCHCNFSLVNANNDRSLMAEVHMDGNGNSGLILSGIANKFMSGILHKLPALLIFTTPTSNSFGRLKPSTWSGAYQCWGENNREAPIRLVKGYPDDDDWGASWRCELKSFDHTANPYIALAVMVSFGMNIRNLDLDLDLSDPVPPLPPPVNVDPETLTVEERMARGIMKLPNKLEDVMALWLSSKRRLEYFLPDLEEFYPLLEGYLAVKASELENIGKKLSSEEQVAMLWKRY
jgi:glutamine synthetase